MHVNDVSDKFLSKFSAEEYYNNLVRAKIQSPMIYLQSHTGLCNYPTESGFTHKRFLHGENELKKLINLCKNGGMKVVGYYSLIFNNKATEAHPLWEMRDKDGKSFRDMGQRYGLCCPNNTEYREFLKQQIDELAREFPSLDGLFFDMPYWEMTCYCSSCKKRFLKETGKPIPEKQDFSDKSWLRFVKARQDFMVDFVRFVREYTEKAMPSVTVEFNFAAVIGFDWLGGSTEGINAECEFTGGDLYGDLYSHSFTCKYYYTVSKNQPFEYMSCRCDKSLREHTITKPEAKLTQEILLTAAHHGASLIIDAIDPIGTLDERVYDRVGKAFSRQLPFEPYMAKGELYAEVAVYFDSKTMYSKDGDSKYNKTCAVSAVRNLIESHIPTAVIANGSLEGLSKYQMIIAPSLQDFDNDEPLKFIDYVKSGGTLYLSGASDPRLMKEFFGARVIGRTYENTPFGHVQLGARVYLAPKPEHTELFGEFNEKYPLPLTYNLPLIEGASGEVKATITIPYSDPDDNTTFASIHSCPPWQATDYPAFIERSYGKGKVIWCAAEIEYDDREAFKNIFKEIVLQNVERKYLCSAGKTVELIVFESNGSTLLSLCDLAYDEAKTSNVFSLSAKTKKAPKALYDIAEEAELPFSYDAASGIFKSDISVRDFSMLEIRY